MAGKYRFTMVITECEEGGYFGICPALQGCYVEGDTYEEALSELKAAIDTHIEIRLERREPIPEDHTTVDAYEVTLAGTALPAS